MTALSEVINNYIIEKLELEEAIYNDVFPTSEGDCVISRFEPSQAKTKEFIDGSSTGECNLGYFVRSSNAASSRDILTSIINCVDNLHLRLDGLSIDVEAVSLPQFVGVDDKNQTIYTATVKAEYLRKRGA